MRVIAGEAKGRRLAAAPGTRPTADRVKEALFSALGSRLPGARVLDLYAGSGALGIEALSRGAAAAVFVERDAAAAAALRRNLEATGLADRATVVHGAVERYVAGPSPAAPYDLVLADPPYAEGVQPAVLETLLERGFLAPGAIAALEARSGGEGLATPAGFGLVSRRRYGDSALVFLEAAPAGEEVRR